MKRVFSIAVLLSVWVVGAQGQNRNIVKDTLIYSGTRLTYPLVEGWIREFTKTNPGIVIRLAQATAGTEKADINFLAYNLEHEKFKDGEKYVVVSNYAQLPVSNSNNPLLAEWKKKGLSELEFKNLYFNTVADNSEKPAHNTVTIYKREKPVCATKTFASHYGSDPKDGKGIGVKGDDRSLLEAVLKDTHGISYNNLGFIYDLNSRKLVSGISVIPADLNDNGKIDADENIYDNLDALIQKLESGTIPNITVDKVNIVYKNEPLKPAVASFIQWVQTDGQKLNHQYGFLHVNTDTKILSQHKSAGTLIAK